MSSLKKLFGGAAHRFHQNEMANNQMTDNTTATTTCERLVGLGYVRPEEGFGKSKAAIRRALEIDEALADAHVTMGAMLLHHECDFPTAEQEFKRALALDPRHAQAHHWYSHY